MTHSVSGSETQQHGVEKGAASPSRFDRRTVLKAAGGAGVASLAGCLGSQTGGGQTQGSASSVTNLHFALGWVPKGQNAGPILARKKGWFADEGLAVQISRGHGSGDTAKRVGAGEVDVGWASLGAAMTAIEQGLDLVEAACGYHKHPTGIISLPETNINEPQDILGKRGAHGPGGDASWVTMQAFLPRAGIDPDDIDWLVVDGAGPQLLIAGRADFVPDWAPNIPQLWYADESVTPNVILVANEMPMYGNGFLTRRSFLEDNEDAMRAFVLASHRGYKHVLDNGMSAVQEAVDALLGFWPKMALGEGSKNFHLANCQLGSSLMLAEEVKETGLGVFDQDKASQTLDSLNTYLLKEELSLDQVFEFDLIESGDVMLNDFDQSVQTFSTVNPGGFQNPLLE